MTYPNHRCLFSQAISHVAVATSLSPDIGPAEKESLAILGTLRHCAGACKAAICDGILRAMDVLIGRIGMEDGCRIRLAIALAEQRGRCHVGGGNSVMDPGLLCQP